MGYNVYQKKTKSALVERPNYDLQIQYFTQLVQVIWSRTKGKRGIKRFILQLRRDTLLKLLCGLGKERLVQWYDGTI